MILLASLLTIHGILSGTATASTSLSARWISEYTVNSVQSVLHMALNTDTIYVGDGRGTVVNVTLKSHQEGNPYQLKETIRIINFNTPSIEIEILSIPIGMERNAALERKQIAELLKISLK